MEKVNNSDTSMDFDLKGNGHDLPISTEIHSVQHDDAPHFDVKKTKALLRKLDWHLVPFLSLLYL